MFMSCLKFLGFVFCVENKALPDAACSQIACKVGHHSLVSIPRGFSTCIESSHVTCSQQLRKLVGIAWFYIILYLFTLIYNDPV